MHVTNSTFVIKIMNTKAKNLNVLNMFLYVGTMQKRHITRNF